MLHVEELLKLFTSATVPGIPPQVGNDPSTIGAFAMGDGGVCGLGFGVHPGTHVSLSP